jgi:hypothetical protein
MKYKPTVAQLFKKFNTSYEAQMIIIMFTRAGHGTPSWTNLIQVGFEVLTAVRTKMAVLWVVEPCSLVEVYQRIRGPCCLHHQGDRRDDGGSKDLWNVGKLLPDYTVLQPRRQPSSYSSPWEPQILRFPRRFPTKIPYAFLFSTYCSHDYT